MNWFLGILHYRSLSAAVLDNLVNLLVFGFFLFMLGCRIATGKWLPTSKQQGGVICPDCGAVNSEGICCDKCGQAI